MFLCGFYGLKTHYSWHGAQFALSNRLVVGQFEPGEQTQVVGHNGTPYVLFETCPTRPRAPRKTKGSLQCGYVRFNAGPEVFQPVVDPVAFNHLQGGKPFALGKGHIPNPALLGTFKIGLGSIAAICRYLSGNLSINPSKVLNQEVNRSESEGLPRSITQSMINPEPPGKKHLVP